MSAYRPYKPIDPEALMKRADFVIELLTMWEETLEITRRNPSGTPEELGTKAELEAAIYVLKRSFPTSELMPVESYDYVKTAVDKMELIQTRFLHDCKLINEDANVDIDTREKLVLARTRARDEELIELDRRKDASV